jgi:hypothetical protein
MRTDQKLRFTVIKSLITFVCFLTFAWYVVYSVYQHQNKADLPAIEPRNADWLNYRPRLLSQKGMIRYYDFEDERRSFGEFRNRGSHWLGDMQASQTQTPAEASFRIVEGRYPGTKAVQTDYYPIEARSYVTGEQGFTVAAWVKHDGPGSVIGGNCPNAGTILALGDGVWAGWKFVLLYPSNVLVFEMGRPKPETSVGTFSVTRVPPKTWTHVAATWDRNHITLYVNGLLCGRVPYSGPYYEVKPFNKLRVGYVGNGLGSVITTCDELIIFDHAKTPSAVLSLATDGEKIPKELDTLLLDGGNDFVCKEWPQAKTKNERAIRELFSYPKSFGTLQLRLAEAELALKEKEKAKKLFEAISVFTNLPISIRSIAKFGEIYIEQQDPNQSLNIFSNQFEQNELIYSELLDASIAYENAITEYDFCLPIK